MFPDCLHKARSLIVLNVVFLAQLLNFRSNLLKVTVVNTRKQVMLDLHIQSTCEESSEMAVYCNVVRGLDLMNKKVLVKLIHGFRHEMVDLAADHELDREQVHRNYGKYQTLESQTVKEERADVH